MKIWPTTIPKRIRLIGFILFALSFTVGFYAFCFTPYNVAKIFINFSKYGQWQEIVLATTLTIGWLSNFTIFFRLPKLAALFTIISPWILYFGRMFFSFNRSVDAPWPDTTVIFYYPFYLWAFGITLIHSSRLIEPVSKNYSRTAYTGS
jgi:hypothetical protein